jgi:hypothetical protein
MLYENINTRQLNYTLNLVTMAKKIRHESKLRKISFQETHYPMNCPTIPSKYGCGSCLWSINNNENLGNLCLIPGPGDEVNINHNPDLDIAELKILDSMETRE